MKPGKRILDIMGFSPPGNGGPVDHDDRQAKRAGRVNLGPRPGSPGVFRNDDLNAMRPHQRKITLKVKRAARDDRLRLWQRERPWRINQAQEVIMLRLAGESGEIICPTARNTRCAGPFKAAAAASISGTVIQRSPSPATHGARVRASSGIPARSQAATALALI